MAWRIKGQWENGGGSDAKGPIEKFDWSSSRLEIKSQFIVVPLVHQPDVSVSIASDVEASLSTRNSDGSTNAAIPIAEAGKEPVSAAGSLKTTINNSYMLFFQQLMIHQQAKHLRQEFINEFTNQKRYAVYDWMHQKDCNSASSPSIVLG